MANVKTELPVFQKLHPPMFYLELILKRSIINFERRTHIGYGQQTASSHVFPLLITLDFKAQVYQPEQACCPSPWPLRQFSRAK